MQEDLSRLLGPAKMTLDDLDPTTIEPVRIFIVAVVFRSEPRHLKHRAAIGSEGPAPARNGGFSFPEWDGSNVVR